MRNTKKEAIAIIDALQQEYNAKLHKAIEYDIPAEISHWQSYLAALTRAAEELERKLK